MNTVILGGNGYIGRNITKYWLNKDKNMNFIILSRSGKNELKDDRITNIAVDVTDYDKVINVLPDDIDYIVDLVGGLDDNVDILKKMNTEPAVVMKQVAENKNVKAMAYVGGVLGSKDFTKVKKDVIDMLKQSNVNLVTVEPTLVYGNGRSDSLTKMVPLLKFFGIFSKKMKPVHVDDVSRELVDKITKY